MPLSQAGCTSASSIWRCIFFTGFNCFIYTTVMSSSSEHPVTPSSPDCELSTAPAPQPRGHRSASAAQTDDSPMDQHVQQCTEALAQLLPCGEDSTLCTRTEHVL